MTLRCTPIRRTGIRDALFLGGDRELVMLTGLLAFTLIFCAVQVQSSALRLTILCAAMILWCPGVYLLRKLAKYDPKIRGVYLRNSPLRYQRYYPARSTPYRENNSTQKKQYQ
jgi:type IV secretory pathway TrbD component